MCFFHMLQRGLLSTPTGVRVLYPREHGYTFGPRTVMVLHLQVRGDLKLQRLLFHDSISSFRLFSISNPRFLFLFYASGWD